VVGCKSLSVTKAGFSRLYSLDANPLHLSERTRLIVLELVVDVHPDIFPVEFLSVCVCGSLLAVFQQCPVVKKAILVVHVFDLELSVKAVHCFFLWCYVLILQYISALSSRILTFLEKLLQVSQSGDCFADCLPEIVAVTWIVVSNNFVAKFADEGEDE
tara:strand:+ start:189 stop:665 length:477 start_codon:yes stop_codon:yes gene_type:complete